MRHQNAPLVIPSAFKLLDAKKEKDKVKKYKTWLMDRACPWLSKRSEYTMFKYETASGLE